MGVAEKKMERARVLYISYDGLMEPLGQSQVLQYLQRLASGHEVVLVSYEKEEDWIDASRREAVRRVAREAGIDWHPLRYHRRPSALATAFDLKLGLGLCLYLVLRHRIQIVHARSYLPAVLALVLKRTLGTRFVFDMRGFWPDERADSGQWPKSSRLYRLAKWYERQFFTAADVIVSLTRTGATAIRALPYLSAEDLRIEVIPTCTNLQAFAPPQTPRNSAGEGFTLGYVGTVGPRYLFDHVLIAFQQLLAIRPAARLLIVNRGQHEYVAERVAAAGVSAERVEVIEAPFAEMSGQIGRMDAGVFFYKSAYSTKGTAPTRLAEFLGCGVPCLGNAGVGDVQQILEGDTVGVVVHDFSPASLAAAVRRLVHLAEEAGVTSRCRSVAERYFSLEQGVDAYDTIYRSLVSSAG